MTRTAPPDDEPQTPGAASTAGNASPTPLAALLQALGLHPEEAVSVGQMIPGKEFAGGLQSVGTLLNAQELPQDRHVWMGLCVMNPKAAKRGSAADVIRVPALWADLDYKPNGVKDEGTARQVVEGLSAIVGTDPTAITHSGGGLQPIWRLECDLETARVLLPRWGLLVARVAAQHGGKADSVYDLARVLRAPGTMNHKYDPPRPTSVEFPGGAVISAAGLTEALDTYDVPEADQTETGDGTRWVPDTDWAEAATTCAYAAAALAKWPQDGGLVTGGRHAWLFARTIRLEAARRLGCITGDDHQAALEMLQEIGNDLRAGDQHQRPDEVRSECLPWATAKVEAMDPETLAQEWNDHDHDEPADIPAWETETDDARRAQEDKIFSHSPLLEQMRQAARAKRLSPLAVLGSALAQVAAETPPHYVLPDLVGAYASLNFAVGLVGSAGHGKGTAHKRARAFLGASGAKRIGPGSGEGLIGTFLTWDSTEKVLAMASDPRAILYADEVGQIDAVGSRNGATFGSVIRSMLTGDEVSTTNADPTRNRHLETNSYRLAIVAGVQPELSDILLRDADAGTPQRFIFMPASDPLIPDEAPPYPEEPYRWTLPVADRDRMGANFGHVVIGLPEDAKTLVDSTRVAQMRGQTVALDGHLLLTRMKVCALGALLHGRLDATPADWEWAGWVIEVSLAQRDACVAVLAEQDKATHRARGRADNVRKRAESEARAEDTEADAQAVVEIVARHSEGEGGGRRHKGDEYQGCPVACFSEGTRRFRGDPARRAEALDAAIGLEWLAEVDGRYVLGGSRPR